eukprot:CAMPEP_0178942904 /NCGR_PEP_ID=MMETSP0789-20121207/2266_1 /TAXON_ID=3005 /ORGANISM="Rhizosolenia setigera, Strain CCMP 1694" /LENGTH=225 /DNA_ID=CAMNT_0020622391 /DNA_START=169 /DNA_END=846 /DNA_ORIENTATION=-
MFCSSEAFITSRSNTMFARSTISSSSHSLSANDDVLPHFVEAVDESNSSMDVEKSVSSSSSPDVTSKGIMDKPTLPKKKPIVKKAPAHGTEGVFSPIVRVAKTVVGDDEINKIRAKVISVHSDTIKGFVDTSDSPFGQATLSVLFKLIDKDGDGKIDSDELKEAVSALGFSWLQEKQINGILKRADTNNDGQVDYEEFIKEAPKTLKTNLVKLAKKNGGDMGLLA